MSRFEITSQSRHVDGASRSAWKSQLVGFQIDGGAVVLDFVALESRPGFEADWPRHTPFTVHVEFADVSVETVEPVLREWSEAADVVELTFGRSLRHTWFCLAAMGTRLIAQVVDAKLRGEPPTPSCCEPDTDTS